MTYALKSSPADSQLHTLAPEQVAAKFGLSREQLLSLLGNHAWPSLTYRVIKGAERDDVMLGILKRIDSGTMRIVGGNDNAVWEQGWGEILTQVKNKGFSPTILRPQYFDHHRIMRLNGEYVDGGDARFVYEYDQLLRRIVFSHYLKGTSKIVELGCGTGTSQLLLAELLPNAKLVASDWATPSQEIVRQIGAYTKRDIKPVNFNMLTLEGWENLEIDAQSTVLTVHALEQLGGGCTELLDRLVKAKPKMCLHFEPIVELYDENALFDYLAIKYHTTRNYLSNWLSTLRTLAKAGKVEIMEERRLAFGDRYHEAYSVIAWHPL